MTQDSLTTLTTPISYVAGFAFVRCAKSEPCPNALAARVTLFVLTILSAGAFRAFEAQPAPPRVTTCSIILRRYNSAPWPEMPKDETVVPDYFGPDGRRSILAELFGLTLEEIKKKPIEIEPPIYVDYGECWYWS